MLPFFFFNVDLFYSSFLSLSDIIFELKMNKKQLERMAKKAEKEEKKEQANVRKVGTKICVQFV